MQKIPPQLLTKSHILKERGIGGYMKIISGSSLFGTDILVEKSSLEKAKTLMDELDLNQ